jgi:hypothetical protein
MAMPDPVTTRLEPTMEAGHDPSRAAAELKAAVDPAPVATVAPPASSPASGVDQLSRIEEKTARIEEKYARSEALLHRVEAKVETATGRMHEVASQSELAALRGQIGDITRRVRALPGRTALVAVAIVTALLTAAIVLAVVKYAPGILAR